jgi:thioredoxin-disulfide reductase
MYDLIIIGGGPAGITAAIYAARKKLNFTIIYKDIGGEVAKTTYVENYTGFSSVSGENLVKQFEQHMKSFDFEHIEEAVKELKHEGNHFTIRLASKDLKSKTVLLATGATPKALNIPGEKEFAYKGVSWCSTCDGPLFAGKEIAVIGAGNSGLTTVLQMEDIAEKVYLINILPKPKADKIMVEKAQLSPKLEILNEATTQSINGTKFVESVTVKQKDGKIRTIPVKGVFINIGYSPNMTCLKEKVELSNFGEIIVDEFNRTSIPGLFAAGDVTNAPYKQIVIAAAHGANAVMAIYDYLAKQDNK